ncbi:MULTISPECIES: helix-turn-helix domain-containing protein [Catenuloplanes]|uniref:HTH arsR-type domain-containing protein n=1 Tax=Catenuloplanes niger TaxID=587534 RepID=A0AAE3ZMA6_9ACTN|nr:helix-turn-helix domain-containing protein [Catenuloplanes niger]MDR7321354.1 hypothetical protein [Catenuloplanes niger]
MIRIWLGPDDLARTRLLPAPLPLHEVFIGVAARTVQPGRELRDLVHPAAFPDFLAPLPDTPAPETLDDSLRRLTGAGRPRVRRELIGFTGGVLNAWHHRLAAGDRPAFRRLADAIRRHHDRHTAPASSGAAAHVQRDVRAKTRDLAATGVEGLFATIHPRVRWHNPVLIVDTAHDLDLRPNGAGVTLIPSVAATRPWVGTDPGAVFIAYPVTEPPAPGSGPGAPAAVVTPRPARGAAPPAVPGDPLAALLGRSRAALLRAATDPPCTTSDLARRVGISLPSASQHLSVLRAAGLLLTTRHGNAAHHVPTSLAYSLLSTASP